ncbi:MAG: GerMN domain-containing protein [Marinisporobacter sp.]|jgi:spore germination protein GerM|nr:GerMN domain-containing protein [Marinisporobacter sp.]
MRKAIFNFFIVVIICITALGMPLNLDLSLPDLSFDLPTQKNTFSYKSSIDSPLSNPTLIDFQIETDTPEKLSSDLSSSFLLDIMKEKEKISTVDASKLIQNTSNEDGKIIYTLHLSKENLHLSDGDYTLKLYSTAEVIKNIAPLKFEVTYTHFSKYVPSTNTFPPGMMGLTLYFPDKDQEYLVPITRFVNYTRTPLGATIKNLQSGSSAFGFVSPIPNNIKLRVQKNRVLVYLPKELGNYNTDQKMGTFALDSFVNSLTSIKGIDEVKFFVNRRESNHFFYGHTTKDIYPKGTFPKVYLGRDLDQKRILLLPIHMTSSEKPIIEFMMDSLKNATVNNHSPKNLVAPIPEKVALIDSVQNNNLLTLNFNKAFLSSYQDRIDLQRMMVDAIVYSFTSIEGIDQIKILVEGNPLSNFGGVDLSYPIQQPSFINPETE